METCISIGKIETTNERLQKGKSLLAFVPDYVVLDLETTGLDPTWNEIIEIGAIKVKNNIIVDQFSSLVKPQEEVDDFITELTGITNEMLENAPEISEILPSFFDYVENNIIVGHNVNFDINFLYDNAAKYCNRAFSNDFIDTMRLSRHLFPQFPHHRLKDLEERFNLQNDNAHRAFSDAMLTNDCYDYMRAYAKDNEIELESLLHSAKHKLSSKEIVATTDVFDENSPIFQRTFVFTGTLQKMVRKDAMQEVVNHGGFCGDSVNKKTNYLVLGNNDYCTTIKDGKSTKHKKAEQLRLSGQDIEIISENVFYDMLNY